MTAIPELTDEEKYLVAIFDDPSGIELAEFLWVDEEQPDRCFRVWDFQWAWYHNEEIYQIDQAGRCIPSGVLVLTGRGQVPIETVVVGDTVWTHRNRWRPVTAVLDQGQQDVVTIKGHGHPGLEVTPTHQFWTGLGRRGTMRRDGHRRKIVEAYDFRSSHDFSIGYSTEKSTSTQWASPVMPSGKVPHMPPNPYRSGRVNTVIDAADPDWLWLYGLYLAEGSLSTCNQGRLNRTTWALHPSEIAVVTERLDRLGVRYNVQDATGNCRVVIVNSEPIAQWLDENGGRRAHGKRLRPWAYGHREILDGLIFGDGHSRKGRHEYKTVSRALAVDVRLLAQSLGYVAGVSRNPPHESEIRGVRVVGGENYVVAMQEAANLQHNQVVFQDGQVWSPIKGISEGRRAHTWDLTVEEDHSFVAEGVVVHNSLGKSMGIRMRAFAFPFNFPGQEMLITAPELNHLRPLTDKIENMIYANRMTREMLPSQRGNGINHQPQFQVRFINNSRIISRLPNRDGRGVKGMHPLVLEADEMQDFPDQGWVELVETMKSGTPGAQWRAHGVSRGIRDRYYRYTMGLDPEIPFYVHRFMAMHRQTWSDKERRAKIAVYGGTEDNVDYRRNIFGEHGDASNPVFVLARLMACVRMNETPWASTYNQDIYSKIKISDELLNHTGSVRHFLDFPGNHLDAAYTSFWGGMDVGYTRDPSEILIFGECKQKGQESLLRLLARIHLMRISAEDQADAVRAIFDFYGERLRCLAMDKTGNGLPLWQMLGGESARNTPDHIAKRIKGYNFSSKVAVDFDDRPLERRERPEDAVIEKNVVDFSTDELRKLVDSRPPRFELPHDQEILTEFQGQEIEYVRDEGSAAGVKKRYSGGSFHTLDAAKMMIAGRNLQLIEEAIKRPRRTAPALDVFVG